MSIFNVSIYIETTIKGPRAGMAAGSHGVMVTHNTYENIDRRQGAASCGVRKQRKMP